MFDRMAFLKMRVASLENSLSPTSHSTGDFDSIVLGNRNDDRRFTDSSMMLSTFPNRGFALPIPSADTHVLAWDAEVHRREIAAIESQDYPDASFWRSNKDYEVNGLNRSQND